MPDQILSQPSPKEQAFESILDPARAAALVRRWDLVGDPVDAMRREQRRQEFLARAAAGQRRREQHRLARQAEQQVAGRLRTRGYLVHPTTHKSPFDLWVQDQSGRAARVEVKISLYNQSSKGGRFQARIHNAVADLLIFIARNGRDWEFVIPMADISPRKNIAIWSACPADYAGRWAPYLDAWDNLDQAIQTGQAPAWQLALL